MSLPLGNYFKEVIGLNQNSVSVIMGSTSDWKVMRYCCQVLRELESF